MKKSSTIVSVLRGSGVVGGLEGGGGVARFRGSEGFVLKSFGFLIREANVLKVPLSVRVSDVLL